MDYTPEVVRTLVDRLFPAQDRAVATEMLAALAATPWMQETARVQVAVLKLSNGSVNDLQRFVAAARSDYRDVLAWAEYPAEMRSPVSGVPRDEMSQIRASDRSQYTEWLEAQLRDPAT